MYHSTIYHSNLSDQSALEIRVRIRVRLRVALFSIFTENKKNEHLIFCECHVLKESTHKINIKYSMHQYSNFQA